MRSHPRSFANHSAGFRRPEPAPISIPASPKSSLSSPQKHTPKLLTSAEMAGLLQPLPVPHTAWSHISMDFVEGLPKSAGKNVILVVIDRFTKYGHFLPLSHPYSAESVAKLFLDSIYKLHGAPISIISDRDKIFTSAFWRELFKLMGTTLNLSSSYHPQTDGQTERLNQCLENYLRCMVGDNPRQWLKWLPLAEYWYNTNFHTSLKTTPFQALYGYPPPNLSLDSYFHSANEDAKLLMENRQNFMQNLRENLLQAQQRMKFFADQKREERNFQVGEMVYLKLQPFRQTSVALRKNLKLSSRFYGPYKILEKLGKVAYRLELPESSKIHPVFHVSLLKKCLGKDVVPVRELPDTDADGLVTVAPVAVLDDRVVNRHAAEVCQILVQWSSVVPELKSWEDLKFIQAKFPTFDPWGQGSTYGGGIVMVCGAESNWEKSRVKKRGKELGLECELGKKGGKQRIPSEEKEG